jgi:ATP-dependent DNA helicase RecQ
MPRPVGKGNLAKALRGSRAKTVSVCGLLTIPQFGLLHQYTEDSLTALIESLIAARKLERRGKKYPTVWLRGRDTGRSRTAAGDGAPVKTRTTKIRGVPFGTTPSGKSGGSPRGARGGSIARELENYRRKQAKDLKWKSYMIFQRRTILAIEKDMPATRDALAKIPGMGPAKIARFGDDVIAVVKRYL